MSDDIVIKIAPDRKLGDVAMQVVKDIIYAEWGNWTGIAQQLTEHLGHKVYREHVFVHIHNRPELLRAQEDARESYIDVSEKTIKAGVLAGDIGCAKYVLSTLGKSRGWSLGVSSAAGDTGQIDTVTTRAVTILTVPSGEGVPEGMQSVAIRPVSSPRADDDAVAQGLLIEGELVEVPMSGFAEAPDIAPVPLTETELHASVREPDPMPEPAKPRASKWGRVSQYDPTPAAPAKPPPEVHPEAPTRLPRSPHEAAGGAKWLWS